MRARQEHTQRHSNNRQNRLLIYDRTFTPVSEEQSKLFTQWELLNRGWYLAPHPVSPEPMFRPFKRQSQPQYFEDDGRQPSFFKRIRNLFTNNASTNTTNTEDAFLLFTHTSPLQKISIAITSEHAFEADNIQQLLALLCRCIGLLSFEIIAVNNTITLQLVCGRHDMAFVETQIKAFLPHCIISAPVNATGQIIDTSGETASIDFGLKEEFMRPLGMEQAVNYYTGLFAVLNRLGTSEGFVYQMLFKGAAHPWKDSIIKSVTTVNGDSFFVDDPMMPRLAKDKVGSPLLSVNIRILAIAPTTQRADSIIGQATAAITNATQSSHNTIMPLSDERYSATARFEDIQHRTTHRGGMLLNIQEAVGLLYIPPVSVSHKLRHTHRKTKAAPLSTVGHTYILGTNSHHGITKTVSLDMPARSRHTHIIGATGQGKSVLLTNLVYQDIIQGNGCAVLDPHGDLVEKIISIVPENKKNNIILIDPADTEYPIHFNILQAATDCEKELIASDLVALFRRFSATWGDQLNSVLANAILAFTESARGGTISDLRRFLVEKEYRAAFLHTVTDPAIVYYWQKEYPLLRSSSIGAILTRLDTFLRPKAVRNMLSQKKGLPIAEWMDNKKIVLIKLAQGLIGAENSYLLGALLVSKIHQAALARQQQVQSSRVPATLYIDEMHHFITESMTEILSGARKYALSLVVAHQSIGQLTKHGTDLTDALLSNAGTRICFRLGEGDAKKLEDGFSFFTAADLQNLGVGEAIARVSRADDDFSLDIRHHNHPAATSGMRDYIVEQTRKKYASHISILKETTPVIVVESKPIKPAEAAPVVEKIIADEEPKQLNVTNKDEGAGHSIGKEPEAGNDEKKEQTEHRYWQTLIKQLAEANGYKAAIEAPVTGGKVDVLLEKDNKTIACEISVTTDVAWEIHNIRKCLHGGFTSVISISSSDKFLTSLKKKIAETFTSEEQQRILVFSPQQLFDYLQGLQPNVASKAVTVKGYRIKVQYGDTTGHETKTKRDLLDKIYIKKN